MYKHELIKLLENSTLLKNTETLTVEERKIFKDFIKLFSSQKNRHLIYRGERNIKEHYNTIIENMIVLNERIFILGQKARFCLNMKSKIRINGIEESDFKALFSIFNTKICNLHFKNETTRARMNTFLGENIRFNSYFSNKENEDDFISKISKCSKKDKNFIRDYYVSLLHTIGKSVLNSSFMISTSSSYEIANYFRNENADGVIFIGWLPRKGNMNIYNSYFCHNKSYKRSYHMKENDFFYLDDSRIYNKGLPCVECAVYASQHEITIKGGLLPHFLLGFLDHHNNFHINPALFSTLEDKKDIKDIVKNGFNINQSNFQEILDQSNYSGFFSVKEGEYIEFSVN